jgi:hypothetical protein
MALALMKAQYRVLVVDTNQLNILAARKEGIPARCANVFLDRSLDEVALDGFGFLFAVTSNDEVNTLAAIHFADIFGSDRVFQLSLDGSKSAPERFLKHVLFGRTVTFQYLQERFSAGAVVRSVPITQELDILGLHEAYGKDTVPLFALGKDSELAVFTPDRWPVLTPGHTLVCLMAPDYAREGEPSSEDVPPSEQKGRVVYLPREGS